MLRKIMKDASQLESFSLLVGEMIGQTRELFDKVVESDNGNEVAKLGLIELLCFSNLNNFTVL